MPLIISMEEGDSFYIDDEVFVIHKIYSDGKCEIRDRNKTTMVGDLKSEEIHPHVWVAAGLLSENAKFLRLIFKAPRTITIGWEPSPPARGLPSEQTLKIEQRALSRGEDLSLTHDDIDRMVYQGAPVMHPRGNVRYNEYWFYVAKGAVTSMGVLGSHEGSPRVVHTDAKDCVFCDGTMKTVMVNKDGSESIIPCRRMRRRELPVCDL